MVSQHSWLHVFVFQHCSGLQKGWTPSLCFFMWKNRQSNPAQSPLGKLRNGCVNRKQTIPRSLQFKCKKKKKLKRVTSGGELHVLDVFHIHSSCLALSHWAESYHLFYSSNRVCALAQVFLQASVLGHIFSSLSVYPLPPTTSSVNSHTLSFPLQWKRYI